MYDISIIYKLQEMTFAQGGRGFSGSPASQLATLRFSSFLKTFSFIRHRLIEDLFHALSSLFSSLRCVYFSIGTFLDPRSQNVFQAVESEELIKAILGMHLSQCTWLTSRKNENVMKNGFKTIGDGKLLCNRSILLVFPYCKFYGAL